MRNFKLTLAYDGTDFHGWQIQPEQPTVQGTLAAVIEKLTQHPTVLHGAGRTDAGVHAMGQIANFKTESKLDAADFQRGCNALLPPTIRLLAAEEVPDDFHARWSAMGKTYRYRLFCGRVVPPFCCRYVNQISTALDFDAMERAAPYFEGAHDFTAFSASSGSIEDDEECETTRLIYSSRLRKVSVEPDSSSEAEWIYEVRGRSFLRYMVRKMVGTLIEVGRGKLEPSSIPKLFERRDRSRSGPTMPPQGLCLVNVDYPLHRDQQDLAINPEGE